MSCYIIKDLLAVLDMVVKTHQEINFIRVEHEESSSSLLARELDL